MIQIDTREKNNDKVIDYFIQNNIQFFRSKLYFGDYANMNNMRLVVERKKDLREIATNLTSKRNAFIAELEKLKETDSKMVILISQDKIDGKKIESLEDIMLWEPKKGQGTVSGYTVYKRLAVLVRQYPVSVQFCSKSNCGKKIVEILGV